MPGPIRQSNLVVEENTTASTIAGATINGVAAGNALVAVVAAHRPSSGTGNIVSGYGTTIGGSAANTWTNVLRVGLLDPGGVWYTELTAWVAPSVTAGNTIGKPAFAQTDALWVFTHMDEWSGVATTSPVDKTATASITTTSSSLTAGPTATLAQASEIVIAVITNRYNYLWNGVNLPGAPPSSFTLLRGVDTNTTGAVAQSVYREVTSTAAVSAAWTYVSTATPVVAGIFTLKQASSTLRLEVDAIDPEITGTTGWTFWAWSGDPLDAAAAKRWTSYSAVLSAGKLVFPDAPAGAALNSTWNVYGYQPSGALSTAMMTGTVRAAA